MRGSPSGQGAAKRKARAILAAAERGVCFGPLFFLQHLNGLVRDRCPDPTEGLPTVHLRLADGDHLDICHIIGVTPKWMALAVNETGRDERPAPMRTELVPYAMIMRLAIRAVEPTGTRRMGFNTDCQPDVIVSPAAPKPLTPEEALQAVAGTRSRRNE